MLTQLLIHVSKEEGSRGEYKKKRDPVWGKFIDGWLSGALNRAGAWTGAAAGAEKKNTPPQAIDRGGAGGRRFRGPGGPVTNTNTPSTAVGKPLSSFHPKPEFSFNLLNIQ